MWDYIISNTWLFVLLIVVASVVVLWLLSKLWHLIVKRADGVEIKKLNSVVKMTPFLLPSREGSTNTMTIRQSVKPFNDFIAQRQKEGLEYNYRDIIIASAVRLFKMRPKFNRFIIGGRFYQRKWIDISMMVHKSLRTGEEETNIKCRFTGYETLAEVKSIVDTEIKKVVGVKSTMDSTVDALSKLPLWMLKFVVGAIKTFDKLGLLGDKFLRNNSPFHASLFITDLRSIGLDSICHHLYNFGNCGTFAALGKEKQVPTVNENGEVAVDKVMDIGLSLDERCFDGLYCSQTLRAWKKMLDNPWCLEDSLEEYEIKS
jgi:hypothetical protein